VIAPLSGMLLKTTDRVAPEDADLRGFLRVGGSEYRVLAFRQSIPGRWTLKLEPLVSGEPVADGAYQRMT
jgi:hypothetical protein